MNINRRERTRNLNVNPIASQDICLPVAQCKAANDVFPGNAPLRDLVLIHEYFQAGTGDGLAGSNG
jgi:hypothetical protein